MEKSTAQRLVRDTLKASFDRKRYRDFINECCNGFDESKAISSMGVPDAFSAHVKSCQRLGTFASSEGELADVLIVQLTESYKLDRTRTALRDFVAHKLKRDESYKEAGLVAFVAPDSQSWRFSYVRMEYETKRDPKTGKIKPEERLTPARRFSYLVGVDEECHTAQSRFLALLQNSSDHPTLAQIEEAFSVESVTKEFFREYVRLFDDTEAALTAIVKRDKSIRDDFQAKGVSTVDFAKKLLGQIVFLYFIQKKGWLGVIKGGKWGDGPRNFMRLLADRAITGKQCLFDDVLEPLFYDTLATDRGHDAWCSNFQCRIPFLNGGLFEPLAGYEWEKTVIDLPNTLFTNKQLSAAGDVGTGILDVFDRYNFTVNEAEPLEMEVAIDPEMLGKVFENLIEDNRRKGLGAFYTPREIVHYMCQESLINYLENGLNRPATFQPEKQQSLVPRKDLEDWISQSDQFAHYAAAITAGTRGDHYPKPPESIRKLASEIDALLRDITVCDPAIGSGAFPVGMMTEIVRARSALTPYFNDVAERTPYYFKRHAIQACIYGTDIDVSAVEIAKLRLWLSLVVDEEDVQQIKPLPNLDYKVVAGDSLSGVEKNLFNTSLFQELEKLKPVYFDESDKLKKERARNKIDSLIHELSDGKTMFDFEIYFSEVFHKGGFDIVIGNPPYLGFQGFMDQKTALVRRFKTARGKFDYYIPFIERALELLRANGFLCFICPTNFMKRGYGKAVRELIVEHASIVQVCDFEDVQVFEGALNYTGIFLLQKRKPSNSHVVAYKKSLYAAVLPMLQGLLSSAPWVFQDSTSRDLIEKLKTRRVSRLEEMSLGIAEGIVTGQNEVFLLSLEKIAALGIEKDVIRPCIRGRQIRRFALEEMTEAVIYPYRTDGTRTVPIPEAELKKYERLWRHLVDSKNKLAGRGYFEASTKQWYELWCQRDMCQLSARKIVVAELAEGNRFCIASQDYFYGDTVCGITLRPDVREDICFVLGLLNSKLMEYVFKKTTVPKANGFFIYKTMFLKHLPLIRVNFSDSKERATHDELVRLVERATAAVSNGHAMEPIESKIDQLVYQLYDLNETEIRLIEDAMTR
jgi:type I restriction-modification system DNA methylase subunit